MAQKSKLTVEQRAEVRRMYKNGEKIKDIAALFNVRIGNITYVCKDMCNRKGITPTPKQIDPAYKKLLVEWEKVRLTINPDAKPYNSTEAPEKGAEMQYGIKKHSHNSGTIKTHPKAGEPIGCMNKKTQSKNTTKYQIKQELKNSGLYSNEEIEQLMESGLYG